MRKGLAALSLLLISSPAFPQDISNGEILKRLQQLEEKVKRLEEENRELKKLLKRSGYAVTPRRETEKLQVDGRVLFRFSQSENLSGSVKSIYGDSGNGFSVRKARVNFHGKLNDNLGYKIALKADRGSRVELWDAFFNYRSGSFSIRGGMFKVPLSMSYLKGGTKLWLPERPVSVNGIAPVWRDVGLSLTYAPLSGLKLTAAVMNGEGWNSGKVYNRDKRYIYTFALDSVPLDSASLRWRLRVGYETGYDTSPKLTYRSYGASTVRRNLIDVESRLDVKPIGLAIEGGYLYDNPKDAEDSSGNPVSLGNAKGFYVQGDYQLPLVRNLHIVGRYSWLDPNDDVDDSRDVDYTSLGFYYLIDGWQAAVRSAYIFANERHGEEKANNLFVSEFQLLF